MKKDASLDDHPGSYPVDAVDRDNIEAIVSEQDDRSGSQTLGIIRAAVDTAAVAIGIADSQGILTYVNKAFLDLWGYTKYDEVIDRHLSIFAHGNAKARDRIAFAFKTTHDRGFWIGEFQGVRRDGLPMELLVTASAVVDDSGRPVAFMASFLNISEIKETNKRLELTQFSVEHISEVIYWVAPDSSFIYFNDAACRMLGYTAEELSTFSVVELDPHLPPERWSSHWEKVRAKGTLLFESEHRKKDGSLLPVEVLLNHLEFQGQEYIVAVVRDITERLEADRRIRDLARFPKENPSPVLRVHQDGRVIYANQAAAPVLAEIQYKDGELLPEPIRRKVREIISGGIPDTVRFDVRDRVYQFTLSPISDEGYLNVYGQDITEIVRVTDELRYNEARYRELFENMAIGIAVYEILRDGDDIVFRDFNRAAEKIDRIERSHILGKSLFTSYPSVHNTGLPEAIIEVWRTGNPSSLPVFEYQDQRISGWRENSLYRLPSGEVVVLFQDITSQKQVEEALRISEENARELSQFRQLVIENADILIVVADPDLNVLIWNKAAEETTGYSFDEVTRMGKLWPTMLLDNEESEFLIEELTREVASGGELSREALPYRAKNGEDRFISINFRPLYDINGNFSAFLSIGRDITLQRLLEIQKADAFNQINRNLEQLAILNDHIRNPLQVIVSLAALENTEHGGEIIRQAEEINNLVRLLDKGWLESLNVASFIRKHYLKDSSGGTDSIGGK